MAGIYDGARRLWLQGGIAWESADIRVLLVMPTYVYNAGHNFVSDVVAHELVATDYARKSTTGRQVQAGAPTYVVCDNVTWAGLGGAVNDDIAGLIFFMHTGSDATARVLLHLPNSILPTQDQDVRTDFENGRLFDWGT